MWTMSRMPSLVTMPVRAPRCWSTALVATVVPCSTPSTASGLDAAALAQLDEPGHERAARVVGRRVHLVHDDLVGVGVIEREIGERPADVDADQLHLSPHSFM